MQNEDIISRRKFLGLLCGAAFAFALPSTAFADDDNDKDDEDEDSDSSGWGSDSEKPGSSGSGKRDQDRVKDAVKKGDAIPLAKALALLKGKYEGRVIEVLYSAKGGRIDYRFKILDGKGKVISVTMDARSGRIRGFLGF